MHEPGHHRVHRNVHLDVAYRRTSEESSNTGKTVLITGITGQDGSYLAEYLLSLGYEVHGMIRKSNTFNTARIDHLYQDSHDPKAKLFLHYADMSEPISITRILEDVEPDEVYNLAAQNHVRVSFDIPVYTG